MTLGQKIQDCRRRAGLSQEALADKVGVSRQAISKWELSEAEPELKNLQLLAKIFDVSTDYLLSEEIPQQTAKTEQVNSNGDNLPKFIGRLFRRFGWLAGVYIAAGGGIISILGSLFYSACRAMKKSYLDSVHSIVSDMSGLYLGALGSGFTDSSSSAMGSFISIISGFGVVIILIGGALFLGGILLALYLRKLKKQK